VLKQETKVAENLSTGEPIYVTSSSDGKNGLASTAIPEVTKIRRKDHL